MIDRNDIEIKTTSKSPGGQVVGVPPVEITATHRPTGIVVIIPPECHIRSQHRAIQVALDGIAGAITSPWFR